MDWKKINSKTLFVLCALILLSGLTLAEDIECFADGECTESLFVGQWEVKSAQDCLETCQNHTGCLFFTYYGQDDGCLGLANCVKLDDENCEECYSGNSTCPDLQCWVPGSCVGSTISVDYVANEESCLEACQADDSCKWLTFDESDGACILLTECSLLGVNDCETCWSSQVQCGERQDLTKVLVIGGYNDASSSHLDNVEAVDLASESPNCDSVSNYPFPVGFPVGTILEGLPTVCGGNNADTGLYTKECYQYLYEENRWVVLEQTMLEARFTHKASLVDSATWLITGGINNADIALYTTEILQNGEFMSGPHLPFPLHNHCQVTLNSSYVAILGGHDGTADSYDFYLFNWKTDEWISMPDVPILLGNDPCGLIENSVNGAELVILRNYNDCHIFNFRDMTWREGPKITYDIHFLFESMPVQMEKTFYLLGGYLLEDTSTDAIFRFDNENYAWHLESARLETARRNGAVIAVPDDVVNCG